MNSRWLAAGLLFALALAALRLSEPSGRAPADDLAPLAREAEPGPVAWTATVDVATGGGRVGPWRMNRSDWAYVDDPTVALDPAGNVSVAWVDQARKDIFFRRYDRHGKPHAADAVNVSRSPGIFSWLPRVALAPADAERVYVLWQEIVFSGGTHGGEAFFARSSDGGRSFGEPLNLSRTKAGAGKGRLSPRLWHNGSLDIAAAKHGRIYAVWTVYEGGLWLSRSVDGGDSFSEPLRITASGVGEPARGPSLALSPEGVVHLVWAVGGDREADLHYARSTDAGDSFSAPRALMPGAQHADAPKLAADGAGRLHLVYAESRPGHRARYRIRYARAGPGGGFDGARTIPATATAGSADFRFPQLTLDGDGDGDGSPIVMWERYRAAGGRSRGLGLAVSRDGGASFGEPVLVPGTADPAFSVNGSLQGLLMRKLAVNRTGDIAVVNSAFEPGEASRVRLLLGKL